MLQVRNFIPFTKDFTYNSIEQTYLKQSKEMDSGQRFQSFNIGLKDKTFNLTEGYLLEIILA